MTADSEEQAKTDIIKRICVAFGEANKVTKEGLCTAFGIKLGDADRLQEYLTNLPPAEIFRGIVQLRHFDVNLAMKILGVTDESESEKEWNASATSKTNIARQIVDSGSTPKASTTKDTTSNSRQPILVLVLDGGGTRGKMLLAYLEAIEKLMGKSIADIFDVIGGTSAGALTGAAMALRRLPPASLKPIVDSIAAQTFGSSTSLQALRFFWTGARNKVKHLEREINKLFGTQRLDSAETPKKPLLLMFACERYGDNKLRAFVFDNDGGSDDSTRADGLHRTSNASTGEALLASAAAPSYFVARKFDGRRLVDGGVMYNCPIEPTVNAARARWPKRKLIVVSIGTGHYEAPVMQAATIERSFWSWSWSPPSSPSVDTSRDLLGVLNAATNSHAAYTAYKATVAHDATIELHRLDVQLTEAYALDEARPEVLEKLVRQATDDCSSAVFANVFTTLKNAHGK